MRTRFWILFVIGIITIVSASVFVILQTQLTGVSPCFDPEQNRHVPCTPEKSIQFYEYKGDEWMSMKKTEMIESMRNNTFHTWIDMTKDDHSHWNVYQYYSFAEDLTKYVGDAEGLDSGWITMEPEPERNPVPEGNYVDKNMYVYSVKEAESLLDFKLSTPYVPQGVELEKIKISSNHEKATLYYSNGLEVSHHPMGKNFNNTHYIENPARPEGKVFYDFDGTYAEGVQVTDPYYSVINIFRADRIYVKATMETDLDELLNMIKPMNLDAPFAPYAPDPDYVMDEPEPEPVPEPEPEPVVPSGLQVDVTGQQQVRRGTTHDIIVNVTRDGFAVPDALVRITIEDYGDNAFRDFKGRTDDSGRFVFSWEIPKSFDDIKTLLAYVDVTDDISAKTVLFKFQVYCLPGETGCKVEGN